MADHIYKKIELVGSSPDGFEEAVKNALARAQKTIRNMRWFEVAETRGYIEKDKIGHWQVTLKIGFTLEECCTGARRGGRLRNPIPLLEPPDIILWHRRLRSPVSTRRQEGERDRQKFGPAAADSKCILRQMRTGETGPVFGARNSRFR